MKLRFDRGELTRQLELSRADCTPELGAMFLDAVEWMVRGPQYRGYGFRDELTGDALLALVVAPRSFRADRCADPNGWLALVIRRSFGKTIKREKADYARRLRLAVDAGAQIAPSQLDWLREHEARGRPSTRVDGLRWGNQYAGEPAAIRL